MFIESVIPSKHLVLCHPLLLLPLIFPSTRVFSNESALCIRWPNIGASASVLPMNIQDIFPLGLTDWPPCSPRDPQESSATPQFKSINSLALSLLYGPTLTSIQDYWKKQALTIWNFVGKVMSLLFNMLSRLVITFLPRSKCLLISWLQSPSAVILKPPQNKVSHCFHCFPIYLHEVMP